MKGDFHMLQIDIKSKKTIFFKNSRIRAFDFLESILNPLHFGCNGISC